MGEDTAAQHALPVTQIRDGKWGKKKQTSAFSGVCNYEVLISRTVLELTAFGMRTACTCVFWASCHIESYRNAKRN